METLGDLYRKCFTAYDTAKAGQETAVTWRDCGVIGTFRKCADDEPYKVVLFRFEKACAPCPPFPQFHSTIIRVDCVGDVWHILEEAMRRAFPDFALWIDKRSDFDIGFSLDGLSELRRMFHLPHVTCLPKGLRLPGNRGLDKIIHAFLREQEERDEEVRTNLRRMGITPIF